MLGPAPSPGITVIDTSSTRLWQRIQRATPDTWLWALVCSIAALYGLRAAWFFYAQNASVHFDDGYVTAMGERLLSGHLLPYVDAASHRGPVMYWLAALAQALGGRMEWHGVRALTSLAFLTSAGGIFAAALLAGRRVVAAFAALAFVFISIWLLELQTVFGLVGESIATPWLVMAFLATSLALTRPRSLRLRCGLLAAAGALSALSGLTKQTYLIAMLPLLVWVCAVAFSEGDDVARRRWAPVLAFAAGWLAPTLAVVLLYLAKGELGTFYYWFYRYNVDVYMAPYAGVRVTKTLYHFAAQHGYLTLALVLLTTSAASQHAAPLLVSFRELPRAYARRGFELTVLALAVFSVAIGMSTLRFWAQYFLPPVPWLALLIGLSLEHALGESPHQPQPERRPWAPLLVAALGFGGFAVGMLEQVMSGLAHERAIRAAWVDARPERLCADIDRLAPEPGPLYIWGFDAEYYITCQRQPASRYVYSTLISGSVPPDWGIHPEWSARNSIDNLLEDLRSTQPQLILDSPQRARGVSITQLYQLDDYLRDNYCEVGELRTNDGRRMTAWQRRDLCPK
jgi:hypothetical protein